MNLFKLTPITLNIKGNGNSKQIIAFIVKKCGEVTKGEELHVYNSVF